MQTAQTYRVIIIITLADKELRFREANCCVKGGWRLGWSPPPCLSQVPAMECAWLYLGNLINLRGKNCAQVPAFPGLVCSRPHLVTLFLLRMSWVLCSAWCWAIQSRKDAASPCMSILYRKMHVNVLQRRRMRVRDSSLGWSRGLSVWQFAWSSLPPTNWSLKYELAFPFLFCSGCNCMYWVSRFSSCLSSEHFFLPFLSL